MNNEILSVIDEYVDFCEGAVVEDRVIREKAEALDRVKKRGADLAKCSEELRRNPEVVRAAVDSINGWVIRFASEDLRDNREIALLAVKNDGLALKYVSKRLQADREIVMEAVKDDGYVIEFASPELQMDPEIRREAEKKQREFERFLGCCGFY